ncbi:unnamed protein product [Schistosoma mattheei]|uniref:Uncharacterized protein n=1 Tax=Schistosoma mattheei TaxID=31246 RepID=A0A183NX48_9TREM|nr:unnamed protein product [Schistosoma mattheei]
MQPSPYLSAAYPAPPTLPLAHSLPPAPPRPQTASGSSARIRPQIPSTNESSSLVGAVTPSVMKKNTVVNNENVSAQARPNVWKANVQGIVYSASSVGLTIESESSIGTAYEESRDLSNNCDSLSLETRCLVFGFAILNTAAYKGIDRHSTRDGKTRSGLIDVDVIRGSVFAKAKTGHGWMAAVRWGLLRVAFAPFYWNYWRSHTSFRVAVYIMVHFFLQFLQVVFFLLTDPRTSNSSQDDLLLPCLLAICLGILHAHITAPHGKPGLYSSFMDNPMTNQSFKDIGDHGLNSNGCQYNPDNLVNNKFSSVQTVINRHSEYDHSSWFPVQSTISEHHKFPANM